MPAGRESERGVLSQQALVSGQPAECQLLMGMIQGELELAPAAAVARLGGLGRQPKAGLPQQLAPSQAESVAATDPHERFDCGAFELRRRSPDEITHTCEWTMLLSLDDGCRGGLVAPMANEPQADPHRTIPRGVAAGHPTLDRAPDVTHVDIRQSHFDAVTHGIAAQRVDRIEAHRLIIEE